MLNDDLFLLKPQELTIQDHLNLQHMDFMPIKAKPVNDHKMAMARGKICTQNNFSPHCVCCCTRTFLTFWHDVMLKTFIQQLSSFPPVNNLGINLFETQVTATPSLLTVNLNHSTHWSALSTAFGKARFLFPLHRAPKGTHNIYLITATNPSVLKCHTLVNTPCFLRARRPIRDIHTDKMCVCSVYLTHISKINSF